MVVVQDPHNQDLDSFRLKRMSLDNRILPPMPKIDGDPDIILDLYTHRSLSTNGASFDNNDYGDTARLAVLGEKVMEFAVTRVLFNQTLPVLNAEEIEDKRVEIMSTANYEFWLDKYGLRKKLRADPSVSNPLSSDKDIRDYFHSFVGAIYHRNDHGWNDVKRWVAGLVNPDGRVPDDSESDAMPDTTFGSSSSRPPAYGSHQPSFNPPQGFSSPSPSATPSFTAPEPVTAPPPVPTALPPPPPMNGHASRPVSNLVNLALVNQTAAQKGVEIRYEPSHPVGPAHSPIWTVRCTVNGQLYGQGTGKNQKLAKEEAARQAWSNLGWCECSALLKFIEGY
ncbi:Interferon-induced, double-stranded RNA-activated protein kinase [Marasmius crinis-equi]|uniref:Interferon-induced, double-stranded RNA-activated protein kinase n=1 Tax=Marasmius crinis-equi TaxID=585013 RepID=A0ABR3FCC6_9AGAR